MHRPLRQLGDRFEEKSARHKENLSVLVLAVKRSMNRQMFSVTPYNLFSTADFAHYYPKPGFTANPRKYIMLTVSFDSDSPSTAA